MKYLSQVTPPTPFLSLEFKQLEIMEFELQNYCLPTPHPHALQGNLPVSMFYPQSSQSDP